MIGIGILLTCAAVAYAASRALGLPSVPLLMVAGFVLARVGFVPETGMLQQILVLGLTVLVFVTGLELNPRRVGEHRQAALRVGIVQFAVLGAAGILVALALGYALLTALYLALALTASSTLVVLRVLQQRRQRFEPFARLIVGVLLLQDLLIILMIPVVTLLPDGIGVAARGLLGTLALMALAYASLRWVTPWLLPQLASDEEATLLSALAVLFVFVGLTSLAGLPLVIGAFLGGLALSPFPVNGLIRGQLNSVADFFLAIFFTALGAIIGIPTPRDFAVALVLAAVVLLITPPLVAWLAELAGFSARAAIESGLFLSQTSEFSLMLALQGLVLGQLTGDLFTVIVLVTVGTMMLTPLLTTGRVTWFLMSLQPLRRQNAGERAPPTDHVLLLGCGDNGMPLMETLLSSGNEVVVVDDDPAVVDTLREGGIRTIRGDGSDPAVLEQAGAARARIVVSTLRRPLDNLPLLRRYPGVEALVRVFSSSDAEEIRAAGGTPVLYSEAAADDFLRWLDQAEVVGIHRERRQRPR